MEAYSLVVTFSRMKNEENMREERGEMSTKYYNGENEEMWQCMMGVGIYKKFCGQMHRASKIKILLLQHACCSMITIS